MSMHDFARKWTCMHWSFVGYSTWSHISFWPMSVEYSLSQSTFDFSPVCLEMLCIEQPAVYCANFWCRCYIAYWASAFLLSSVLLCLAVCVLCLVKCVCTCLLSVLSARSVLSLFLLFSSVTIHLISLLYKYILHCAFIFVCMFIGITAILYFQDNIRLIGLIAFWRCLSV